MRIDHHHYIELNPAVRGLIDGLSHKLDFIIQGVKRMSVNTDKLLADVTAQTTVLNSLILFVQGQNASNADLTKQVADLKAALAAAQVNDPIVQAAIDAIDATAQSNTALAQGALPAVTANTSIPPAAAVEAAAAAAQPA